MERVTGLLVFSFLFLGPLGAAGQVKNSICPPGYSNCTQCGCLVDGKNCPADCQNRPLIPAATITLEKKENTLYSLPEGVPFKCENNKKIQSRTEKDGTIIYTCGTTTKGNK